MATAKVSLIAGSWVSLGTGPMYLTPSVGIQIVASATQPTLATQGHPVLYASLPFYFTLAEQLWAINPTGDGGSVVVTT
jgi:hypothetical protein